VPSDRKFQELLDRDEIRAAMAVYARSADLYEPEQQASVFVDDCRVSYHPEHWITGRAALIESLHVALAKYSRTSHHVGTIEIDFTGPDEAAAQSTVLAWHRRVDGSEWTMHGRYVDRWTRTPDGWRMTERQLRAAGATGRDESQLPTIGRTQR